jgi:hypothetical protein
MAGIWDGMDAAAMCGCMASQCHTVQCDAAHAAQYYGSQYLMPPMECHWRGYGAALHLLAASGIARHGIGGIIVLLVFTLPGHIINRQRC